MSCFIHEGIFFFEPGDFIVKKIPATLKTVLQESGNPAGSTSHESKLQPLKIQGRKCAEGRDVWIDEDLSSAPSGQRQPIGCLDKKTTPETRTFVWESLQYPRSDQTPAYIAYRLIDVYSLYPGFCYTKQLYGDSKKPKKKGLVTNQQVFQTPLGFVSTLQSTFPQQNVKKISGYQAPGSHFVTLRISSCCCCSVVQIPRSLEAATLGQR